MDDVFWKNPPCFGFLVSKTFLFYPVHHPIKLHVHCLGFFCLTVVATMPSVAEFSIFIGVGGWIKPSSWSVTCRGTDVCPLCNSHTTSALVADATTWLRILHPCGLGYLLVVGGLEIFSGRLLVSWGNSALQCGCVHLDMIGMMHHFQCEVSYS